MLHYVISGANLLKQTLAGNDIPLQHEHNKTNNQPFTMDKPVNWNGFPMFVRSLSPDLPPETIEVPPNHPFWIRISHCKQAIFGYLPI